MALTTIVPTKSTLVDLDFLLDAVVAELQLPASKYRRAVDSYQAVGRWLEHPRSPLRQFRPTIYPQGSMVLQTTVKPIGRGEHDLDLVSQMCVSTGMTPMGLYETTYAWLAANENYRPILERFKRCIRLNYTGDFHLDVVPAEPDTIRPLPCIQVPDRKIKDWTTSNPVGYIAWFNARSAVTLREGTRAMAPVPVQQAAEEKSTLSTVVQVIKRRRDWAFLKDAADAPRSILLTTLAGTMYEGESSVVEALRTILVGIERAIITAASNRIVVVNPANPDERFCESFTDHSYEKFVGFIRTFREEVDELLAVVGGIPALRGQLASMFGDDLAVKAVNAWGARLQARRSNGLTFGAASGLAVTRDRENAPHPVPRNNFYGEG